MIALPSQLPSLAVLDWGIGGFGFVAALVAARPEASFVYVSDAGFTPYGRVPARALADRVSEIARALARRGVEHLVIACNAASTVASPVRATTGVRVTDVVSHGVDLAARTPSKRIGVVGGERTVRAGVIRAALVARGKVVVQRIAQPLSARIERGDLDSPDLVAELARIVLPLRGIDALLLACTHYPAIRDRFAEQLPGTLLLDPTAALLATVLRAGVPSGDARVILTTGDARATRAAATRAFGFDPGDVCTLERGWLRGQGLSMMTGVGRSSRLSSSGSV